MAEIIVSHKFGEIGVQRQYSRLLENRDLILLANLICRMRIMPATEGFYSQRPGYHSVLLKMFWIPVTKDFFHLGASEGFNVPSILMIPSR